VEPSLSTTALRREVDAALARSRRLGPRTVGDVSVLHGNGNVIAVVEMNADPVAAHQDLSAMTRAFCDAIQVVRIDGVLYFYPPGRQMRFYDRDGTWEAMCGNGLRCVTRYAFDRGYIGESDTIRTEDGNRPVRMSDGLPEVSLGRPRELNRLADDRWFLYNGVAHVVIFRDDVDAVDVVNEGRKIRHDERLCAEVGHPEGVHVNFAAVRGGTLIVRTYEVGVEDETLSCGTGVAAAGYASWIAGRTPLPVEVKTAGGWIRVAMRGPDLTIRGAVTYLLRPGAVQLSPNGHLPAEVA
jgi:diaminopimelate epimerase